VRSIKKVKKIKQNRFFKILVMSRSPIAVWFNKHGVSLAIGSIARIIKRLSQRFLFGCCSDLFLHTIQRPPHQLQRISKNSNAAARKPLRAIKPFTCRSLILAFGPTEKVRTPDANDLTSLLMRVTKTSARCTR
jgi:hypothetical protein